ncbi:MAG: ABC transporter ATP-binding protein [Chitinophagaceae bacterium]
MSSPAIKVDNIGKSYIISHEGQDRYTALRDVIARKAAGVVKKSKPVLRKEEFWALKDISFDIKQGEAVGIIGRNGAGKSTLLKILSRITEPTRGRIEINGRIASLLEVGTGFHPELTGRENIFLNGAILGMSRAEIKRKFDEIVDFSGVEKFLDTPVKRYSSGMYVRLAFAVAAHLEPEILVVDEVLAVGDAEFQRKCLGKMNDVSQKEGRTVLFVSHQMDAISRLCQKVIVLNGGNIQFNGNSDEAIKIYHNKMENTSALARWDKAGYMPGNELVKLVEVAVVNEQEEIKDILDIRQAIGIRMKYMVLQDDVPFTHGLNLYNAEGVHILSSHDIDTAKNNQSGKKGEYETIAWIPANFLAEGLVSVSVAIMSYDPFLVHFHENDTVSFTVIDSMEGDSARGVYGGPFPGIVRPILKWKNKRSI